MKKAFTVFFFIINCFFAEAQKYSKIVSNAEISNFITQLDKSNNLHLGKISRKILVWEKTDINGVSASNSSFKKEGITQNDSCLKYLSKADVDFIIKQSASRVSQSWLNRGFENYTFLNQAGIDLIYKRSQDENLRKNNSPMLVANYFYSFSIPLFNQKRDVAIIKYEYNCGFLCATRCTYLFKRINGVWTKIADWECYSE